MTRLRYLTPTVDINYEYIRYLYRTAANALADRERYYATSPGSYTGYAYRLAREHANTDRERRVVLAFCRQADAMKAEAAAGWPTTGTNESGRADVRALIDDCAPFAHAPADDSYSGNLADADGVDPIPGAVVSVEWNLVTAGDEPSGSPRPTRLATWQVRTGPDGYFEMPAPAAALDVPSGTTLARGAWPDVRVYALGRDAFRTMLDFDVLVDGTRVTVTKWPPRDELMSLSRPRLAPEELAEQVNAWYVDAHRAIREETWPGGERQALESYRPLLDLLAEACTLVAEKAKITADGCQDAQEEFGLEAPAEFLAELNLPPTSIRAADRSAQPIFIIGGSEPSHLESMKQAPPPD